MKKIAMPFSVGLISGGILGTITTIFVLSGKIQNIKATRIKEKNIFSKFKKIFNKGE